MGIQIQIPNRIVIDFRDPAQTLRWTPVNDRVMGGVSTSQATATAEGMAFIGVVSLDNNGGFASIRALPREYGLAGTSALILRIRGDGQTYKFGYGPTTPLTVCSIRLDSPRSRASGRTFDCR
jgi:hypothetical protein